MFSFLLREDGKVSKTVVVGILEVIIAVMSLVASNEYGLRIISDNPEIASYLLLAVGILTVILRKLTNQPMTKS